MKSRLLHSEPDGPTASTGDPGVRIVLTSDRSRANIDRDRGFRLGALVRRHPLVAFFVLAFAFSWWPTLLAALGWMDAGGIASFGPFIAALVVLPVSVGRRGVVALLRRTVDWRVGWRWYVIAFFLPLVVNLAAAALSLSAGAAAPSADQLSSLPEIGVLFAMAVLVPGFGGAWEEPGWRGYALPRLLKTRSPLAASVVLGVVVALWHLPVVVNRDFGPSELVATALSTVVFTWVYVGCGRSVLIPFLLHAANNALGIFFFRMFADDVALYGWMWATVWAGAAAAVIVRAGRGFSTRAYLSPDPPDRMLTTKGALS